MNRDFISSQADFFQKNGYVIFSKAINLGLIENFTQEFDNLIQENTPLKVNLFGELISFQDLPSTLERDKALKYGRFIDIEAFSELGKKLIFDPTISTFLEVLYRGNKPTNLQSLTYKYSSQQGEHSDRHLVSPDWAGKYDRDYLTASWIALEDADPSNGALVIYPGSHLIPNKKRLDLDFKNDYQAYVKYCQKICQQNQIEPKYFYAQQGDILFWHGDFIHAGGAIQDWTKTRFSLVCHYANIDSKHFPLSLKNFRCYRQRVIYEDLGYFYQDLPPRHLQRDLLKLWDTILIKQHRIRVRIALARHKTKKAFNRLIGHHKIRK